MIKVFHNKSSLLYHVTKASNLLSILDSNILLMSKSRNPSVKPDGVSFTRDINFTKGYFKNSVVLVFDKNKISNNYKLQPVTDHPNGLRARIKGRSKAEEVLVNSNLNNVTKYLIKIIIHESNITQEVIDILTEVHIKYPCIIQQVI